MRNNGSISKLTALILAYLILGLPMYSCSDNSDAETKPVSESSSESSSDSAEEVTDPDATHYYNDFDAVDYGGWKMNIATGSSGGMGYCFASILVEDLTGDVFNDAIYNRQTAVQDKYNVKIVEHYDLDVSDSLTKSVSANTADYAFGYQIFTDEIGLFCNNVCIGVSDMPVFDLTQPWWDQGAIEDLSIGGKMYYGFSDMGFGHYDSNMLLYYNGVLLDNNQLESPYDLYKEGKWTMDVMHEMMQKVSNDENGDGKMKAGEDIFGFVGRVGKYMPMLAASGLDIISWDDSTQTVEFDVTSDDVMAIGQKTGEIFLDKSIALPEDGESRNMFKAGDALFYCHLLGEFRNLRDQEDDYGIINWPTLRENMTGRMYTVNPECYFIPADCPDTERLATLIDAMNMYTYDYVIDDYVEKAVIGKGARDQQSAEIIREHFYMRAYDLADAFGLSSPQSAWNMAITKGIYSSIQQRSAKTVVREMDMILSDLIG